MKLYREKFVNELKAIALSENLSDRESFFRLFLESDSGREEFKNATFLHYKNRGRGQSTIQIDGYSFSADETQLTLFIIPPLSYFEEKKINSKTAHTFFKRAVNFFERADEVIALSEESSDGVELAHRIVETKASITALHIILLTDGIKIKKLKEIEQNYSGDIPISYDIYDINYFLEQTDYNRPTNELVIHFSEEFGVSGLNALKLDTSDEYTTFLCGIPADLLVKLYDKYRSRLLENNLRTFLQVKGKINQGIKRTITENPEHFLAFNNGITSIANGILLDEESNPVVIQELVGWQIVNGGQTTVSLVNVWRNEKNPAIKRKISKIIVPMKIIVVSENATTEFISDIAQNSNLQNKLSKNDFFTMNPFYIKIERLSRQMITPSSRTSQYGTYWYYERVKNQYRHETYKETTSVRKKFANMNPKSQKFKSSDIAKCLNIYYGYPEYVMSGSEKSIRHFNEVVVDEITKGNEAIDQPFFKKLISLLILYKMSGRLIKDQIWYTGEKKALVVYTLSYLFFKIQSGSLDDTFNFDDIWKEQTISFENQSLIVKTAQIIDNYFTSIKNLDISIDQWVKNKECWHEVEKLEIAEDNRSVYEEEPLEKLETIDSYDLFIDEDTSL